MVKDLLLTSMLMCLTLPAAATPLAPASFDHTADHAQRPCEECHSKSEQVTRTLGLKFSHQLHRTAGIECAGCHSVESTLMKTPKMEDCTACHQERGISTRCDACHVTKANGTLRTHFATHVLKPSNRVIPRAEHHENFNSGHGITARLEPALCRTCHEEDQCQKCHLNRSRMTGIHPGDYLRMHAVEARHRTLDCQSCHNPIQFCAQCHTQAGITISDGPRSFGRQGTPRRFHPPGFTGSDGATGRPGQHGLAARRNLQACVSCHVEDDCVRCHSAGAPASLRATPHPPGFQCGRALDVNVSGCLKCHQDRASLLRRCQGR